MFESGQLTVLNMQEILPNRFQPRIRFDSEKLEELAESIGKYGVIQPIVVRPVGNKFEIIAGERRFKASRLANRSTIPAIIVNLSDKDSEEIALLENIQRQQLSPIEEAVSYKRILDMGYITQEELARKLGKAQSTIANKIRLLNLDDEVQSYLLNNKISERHARSLLRIPDKDTQVEMLHRIVEERLTVKQTDKEIEKLREEKKINNKVAKSVNIDLPKVNVKEEVHEEVKPILSTSDEIENLFDETEKIELSENERGNNMDIDKIMREAKDINIPQETPKDISGLMQPGNDIQSEPIIREDEGLNQVNLENNRFINVAPEPQQQKKVQPVNNSGVTFDSMFNQHVNIEPNPTNNVQNNVDDSVKATMSSSSLQNNVTQVNTVSEVTPISNVSVEPTVTPLNSSPSEVNANTGIPEVTPVVNNQDEVSDDTKKEISSAVADALRRFNQKKKAVSTPAPTVAEPIAPQVSASVPEPSISNINTPVEPVSNINPQVSEVNIPSAESAIPSTDIISDNALNEYAIHSDTAGTMASSMVQDVKPVNNQAHFAEIVKLLRDCADKIEQSGYFVNVDELDLGNQYKVTFTINKE